MKTLTITKDVYTFDELSESAQDNAISQYREDMQGDPYWFEASYDDFREVADILGITFKSRNGGSGSLGDAIYWQGFYSQGCGLAFEGDYRYSKGSTKLIRSYAPLDSTLHAIADELASIQKANFYQLGARTKCTGHYFHLEVSTWRVDSQGYTQDAPEATEDALADALRDFASWMYKTLETEYDYRTSDETIREYLKESDRDFDEDGNLS